MWNVWCNNLGVIEILINLKPRKEIALLNFEKKERKKDERIKPWIWCLLQITTHHEEFNVYNRPINGDRTEVRMRPIVIQPITMIIREYCKT